MNTLGYYGIFFGLQYQNTVRMVKAFDEDQYDITKAVVIRMPIAIPYAVDSRSFERVDGAFEYKGEFYRLIKQKFERDTLQVLCIKDERHREIHQELVRYAEAGSNVVSTIGFIKDYLPNITILCCLSLGWETMLQAKPVITQQLYSYHRQESPPPKVG